MNLDRLLHIDGWVIFGLLGQLFFTMRFLVQWVVSERSGRSTVPVAFWYLSIMGGLVLLTYALLYRQDPVFTLGQSAGIFVYTRNLVLIRRARVADLAPAAQRGPGPGA